MAVLPTDYTDATTPTGATTEYPATTARGLNATHTQINTNSTDIATKLPATSGTLTTPTLSGKMEVDSLTAGSLRFGHAQQVDTADGSVVAGTYGEGLDIVGTQTVAAGGRKVRIFGTLLNDSGSEVYPTVASTHTVTNKTVNLSSNTLTGTKAQFNTAVSDGDIVYSGDALGTPSSGTLTNCTGLPSTGVTGMTSGNTSQQSQVVVSGTAYYIAGSAIAVPTNLAVGSRFRWTVAMAKTAAGTGTFQIRVYRGTNGSTADTADVTQTIGTQTAAVDNMTVDVELLVTTTGGTGAYYWAIIPTNKAVTATGFGVATGPGGQFSGTVSSVALNTASLKFGLSFIATTGTPTITVPLVRAQAYV